MTRANGASTTWTYNAAGQLSQLKHDLPGTADDQTLTYTYNPAGQILTRVMSNTAYAYAPAAGTVSYANNGRNQVTSVGGSAVSYDARQNITTAPSMGTYAYDNLNQMTSATVGGTATSFLYDPAGRMSQMGTTRLLHDGARPIAEYNAAGAILRRYVPGLAMDETVTAYEGSGVTDRRWLLADERLSVTAYTNGTGGILARNTYDEYGQPGSGNAGLFQYTGQIWLPQAQAYHYKARVYAPQLGRFMQTDPIGYQAGANLYAYVGADPVNWMDPWGFDRQYTIPNQWDCFWSGTRDNPYQNFIGCRASGWETITVRDDSGRPGGPRGGSGGAQNQASAPPPQSECTAANRPYDLGREAPGMPNGYFGSIAQASVVALGGFSGSAGEWRQVQDGYVVSAFNTKSFGGAMGAIVTLGCFIPVRRRHPVRRLCNPIDLRTLDELERRPDAAADVCKRDPELLAHQCRDRAG